MPDVRGPVRYLWWLVRCQGRRVLLGAFFGSLWMVTLAAPPFILSRAIDEGLIPRRSDALMLWGAALLATGVLNAGLAIGRHRTMTRVRMDAQFRTVRAVTEHVSRLGADLGRQVSAGEVAAVGIGDVATTSTALTVMGPGVGAVVAYGVAGSLLWRASTTLAIVALVGVPILCMIAGPLLSRLVGARTAFRLAEAQVSARLLDVIQGLRVLNAFGGKDMYASHFRRESDSLRDQGYKVAGVASWIGALGVGLPAIFLAAVTWLAARMAATGAISAGELVAVYGYVAMLAVPVSFLIEGADQLTRGYVSAGRIIEFLRLQPRLAARAENAVLPDVQEVLVDERSGVRVEAGRFVAIVSEPPADAIPVAERLAYLIPSDATWGGSSMDSMSRDAIRSRVLLADSDAHVFAGSLAEVVAGRFDVEETSVLDALRSAAAEDVAHLSPRRLHAHVLAGGANLSGGQRQRVRLARALLADPDVLIAVDPTSSLDAHTEALLAERLRVARTGRTTVVVAASPVLLAEADLVYFLVGGNVQASGGHDALLASCPQYATFVARETGSIPPTSSRTDP